MAEVEWVENETHDPVGNIPHEGECEEPIGNTLFTDDKKKAQRQQQWIEGADGNENGEIPGRLHKLLPIIHG